jgi:hypothetical protein
VKWFASPAKLIGTFSVTGIFGLTGTLILAVSTANAADLNARVDKYRSLHENLRLRNLWDGIDTYAAMLAELRW